MKKIVLADDDRLILTTLAAGLRQAGYQVFEAASGERALALVEAQAPDLLILDICMPGLSGLDVAERLQASGIPMLFLTAYGDNKIVRSAVAMGAMGYLVKPVDVPQLIPEVEAVLGRAADLHQLRAKEGHLRRALAQKRETSVAIGILMQREGLDLEQAFETLRRRARSRQCKLVDLAAEVVRANEAERRADASCKATKES